MKDKDTRGRKMKSDNVRVVPEFREHVDIEKLCQALIEIAKSIAKEQATTPPDKPTQTEFIRLSFWSQSNIKHTAPDWFLARIWYTDKSLKAVKGSLREEGNRFPYNTIPKLFFGRTLKIYHHPTYSFWVHVERTLRVPQSLFQNRVRTHLF